MDPIPQDQGPTGLLLEQVLLLVVVPDLGGLDLRGELGVDVVAVADVVHAAAAAGDDALDLLRVVHLRRLVPV